MSDLYLENLRGVKREYAKNMTIRNTGLIGLINRKITELNIPNSLQINSIIRQYSFCAKVVI